MVKWPKFTTIYVAFFDIKRKTGVAPVSENMLDQSAPAGVQLPAFAR